MKQIIVVDVAAIGSTIIDMLVKAGDYQVIVVDRSQTVQDALKLNGNIATKQVKVTEVSALDEILVGSSP